MRFVTRLASRPAANGGHNTPKRAEIELATSDDGGRPVDNGLLNPTAREGTRGDTHCYRGPPATRLRRTECVERLFSQPLTPKVSIVPRL